MFDHFWNNLWKLVIVRCATNDGCIVIFRFNGHFQMNVGQPVGLLIDVEVKVFYGPGAFATN